MSEQLELQERGVAVATGVFATEDAVVEGMAAVVPEEEQDMPDNE
ncbi:hypothetical protein ACFLV7_10910 [Chloroflexota bacterium]